MRLRNSMLTGLGVCVFTLLLAAIQYPAFESILLASPWILVLMIGVVVWNAYAAIWRTHPRTDEDVTILRDGARWGIAVGCAWTLVTIIPMAFPVWFLALFSGTLLPWFAGAFGAIKSGRVRSGMRVGFWSSAVGGLIGFTVATVVGYLSDFIPVIQVMHIPSLNSLQLGISFMFFLGTVPGTLGGLLGGWVGLSLYRTGEPRVPASSL